ncbi:glycoside hydrolase family 2 protein [Microlunatus soli]|uniref:Glycosyl hydrolases family 2 n=1 Tax=Microlunatus soli TaxID=630515 RepID=A0A1H1Q2E8_9ACTN|nr:glycoside hydrolase family 2 TIM barrel-domain containing protein [Microlunatus soli]SDS17574.1 Glycosyl hydrolases family 2 [Microlunatus soli]
MTDDYPRPDFRRDTEWGLLDGSWEFARSAETTPPTCWPEMIMVPYGWDTEASGVAARWLEVGWYRLRWTAPTPADGHRLIVHFGAVQHETTIFVDGLRQHRHTGGQVPFEVDLTEFAGDRIELCVRVRNPRDKGAIPHGKQRSIPLDPYDSCSFSPCSGIWQSVWWELRPERHLAAVELRPRSTLDGWDATIRVAGPEPDPASTIAVDVLDDPSPELVEGLETRGPRKAGSSKEFRSFDKLTTLAVAVDEPRPWSPADPHLYEIAVEVRDGDQVIDRVIVTTGIRTIETRGRHLFLNGERIFLRGVLDQGYWPRYGWTAPDGAALTADLDHARRLGFNLVRKHLKLEDPRWLHHADRIGMLVWEEPASTSRYSSPATVAFADQIAPMVARDGNHPCIVIWGLYNEEWGLDWDVVDNPVKQRVLADGYRLIKELDDSRPVVDCSGWSHVATDLADWHVYSDSPTDWRNAISDLYTGAAPGFDVDLGSHVERKYLMADRGDARGLPVINSEYGTGRTAVDRAWAMRWQTQELRRQADNNGYVYTELYDVEHEFAGVLTFDRSVKDDLGLTSSDVHAETVIITDLDPIAPGIDVISTNGEVTVPVRLSHHGRSRIRGTLAAAWSQPGNGADTAAEQKVDVVVDPYRVSDPTMVRSTMPTGSSTARLRLWLVDESDQVRAHTVVDVVRAVGRVDH